MTLTAAHTASFTALAIDRKNGFIYTADSSDLYRYNLDGSNEYIYNAIDGSLSISNTYALAVDEEGMVYIYWNPEVVILSKLDPGGNGSILVDNGSIGLFPSGILPADMVVKDGFLYVINTDGSSGYKILKCDLGLNLVGQFGDYPGNPSNPQPGELAYPTKFAAVLNRKFYVMDEAESGSPPPEDRVVSFSGFSVSEWETFGQNGTGGGQFGFFYEY